MNDGGRGQSRGFHGRVGVYESFYSTECSDPTSTIFKEDCHNVYVKMLVYFLRLLWPAGQTFILHTQENQSFQDALESGDYDTLLTTFVVSPERAQQFSLSKPEETALFNRINVYFNRNLVEVEYDTLLDRVQSVFSAAPAFLWVLAGAFEAVNQWIIRISTLHRFHLFWPFWCLTFVYNINLKSDTLNAIYLQPPFNSVESFLKLIEDQKLRIVFQSDNSYEYRLIMNSKDENHRRIAQTFQANPPLLGRNLDPSICQVLNSVPNIVFFSDQPAHLLCDPSCVVKSEPLSALFPPEPGGAFAFNRRRVLDETIAHANLLLYALPGYVHNLMRRSRPRHGKCLRHTTEVSKLNIASFYGTIAVYLFSLLFASGLIMIETYWSPRELGRWKSLICMEQTGLLVIQHGYDHPISVLSKFAGHLHLKGNNQKSRRMTDFSC